MRNTLFPLVIASDRLRQGLGHGRHLVGFDLSDDIVVGLLQDREIFEAE